ncbi:hypothetical protein CIL03_18215 [Virgibacillus indicus]|uniref:DUF4825 domain-containing protein n=1 Tax=Virgibacillus indicus TaxID=2024554 RepID=A0A265N5R8_9BACI|nr:hypothetical protein [Virgibacillus indicus]OZU87121.1 hypothetical protein CIL03_18215 [Virgibacillus indicus]
MKKCIYLSIVPLLFLLLIQSGCNNQETAYNYYLALKGESDNWNLNGYEIEMTQEKFKAGNGTLKMKSENEYKTDSFHFNTHAVINNEDITIHSGSDTGLGIDIAEETTGTIEAATYLNKNGDPITLDEISDIYIIVEWWDRNKSKNVKERINLYRKTDMELNS